MDVKKIPLGKMTENRGNIHFQYCIQTLAQAFFLFYEKAFCEFLLLLLLIFLQFSLILGPGTYLKET